MSEAALRATGVMAVLRGSSGARTAQVLDTLAGAGLPSRADLALPRGNDEDVLR